MNRLFSHSIILPFRAEEAMAERDLQLPDAKRARVGVDVPNDSLPGSTVVASPMAEQLPHPHDKR